MTDICDNMFYKEFLINKSYGGFGYSQKAVDIYNNRMLELDPDFKRIRSPTPDYQDILRDDPVMIQVVKDLGIEANDRWSNLKIIKVPYDYYFAVDITSIDGLETWKINFSKYKLHKIEKILFSPIEDYEKISKIYSIISANITLEILNNELSELSELSELNNSFFNI